MTILSVLFHPHPVLRQKAETVEAITPEILQLLEDMLETMYDAPGIGLAAPQVGIAKRIAVMDVESERDGERGNPICLINPEIVEKSESATELEEGCLSLPTMLVKVTRPEQVTVRYMNEKGETCTIEADGLLAKCLQHEIDHLNGVLIFDYLSPLKRNMVMKKYQKALKEAGV